MNEQEGRVEFRDEESRVEQRSCGFKKELGLTDLVLTQILFIVGLPWVGVAAKQGPSHILLWLGRYCFLHTVGVRGDLSQPGDAARGRALSMGKARIAATSIGVYDRVEPGGCSAILNTVQRSAPGHPNIELYIMGPGSEWLTANAWFSRHREYGHHRGLILVTVVGLGVGKWVHKAGRLFMILIFARLSFAAAVQPGER
jgi:hypothetical protein